VDADEFDSFYTTSVRRLTGQLYAMTGDLAEAQDVVHEAFAKAWDRRRQLATVSHPEAWVRTVAWRLAVSRWRRSRRALVAWQRRGEPQTVDLPDVGANADLLAAVKRLPAEQRRAVVLFYLCDMSIAQVSDETGAPVGTVKARLSRARNTLAKFLSESAVVPRG
jgi:RNA polymerase sigma-70 factor, ECF subfamily